MFDYQFIPKVKLRSHQHSPWMKLDLHHELNCLHFKMRKFKYTGNKQGLECIQRANQSFHQNHITEKSEYESKLINDCLFFQFKDLWIYSGVVIRVVVFHHLSLWIPPQLHLIRTKQPYLISISILFSLPAPSASLHLQRCSSPLHHSIKFNFQLLMSMSNLIIWMSPKPWALMVLVPLF